MNGLFRIDAVRAISGLQLQLNDGVIHRHENEFAVRTRNKCIPVLEIKSSDLKAPQEQQFHDTSIPSVQPVPSVPSVPAVLPEIFTCATLACEIISLRRSSGALVL